MSKSPRSLREKEKKDFSLSSLGPKLESLTFYLLILLLPTQVCKHFWPPFSQILGIRVDYLSPTIYATDILILILFIFWIIRNSPLVIPALSSVEASPLMGKAGLYQNIKAKINLSLLIIFPYLLLTILLSGHPSPGLYQLIKTTELFFLGFYIAKKVKTKNELAKIIFITSASVIGESLLAIAQYIHHGSIGGPLYFLGERTFTSDTPGIANASINGQLILRPYATFSHPNVLAGYLLCMLIMISSSLSFPRRPKVSMVRESSPRNIKKTIKILALLLGQIALMLTLSRTAILLSIILLFATVVIRIKNSAQKKLPLIFTALFIAVLIIACLFYTPALARLKETTTTEQSFTQRIDLLRNALSLIIAHPLFGVGLGNYLPAVATIQKPLQSTLYIQPVHNIFLLLLSETGIIGLLVAFAFLFKTYRRLLSFRSNKNKSLLIILSSVLILGLLDHYWLTLQQGQLLLALILGLSWSHPPKSG